ncbi:hypothetical protein HII31_00350 [Pseudocercospora fuligena]|uniref:Uncharacterized protein n=1 Tax=Pseudocercospora fuligena TaxID=685502 RepID=A0A8H6RWV5_9PEZI|nr:hypothetical protein HII31_00350 [Pseudocercospora fuligena]
MDLPKELRDRVYDFIGASFSDDQKSVLLEARHEEDHQPLTVPNRLLGKLSLVSHEVRMAVNLRFFATTNLLVKSYYGRPSILTLDDVLKNLSKPLGDWRLKFLRKMWLQMWFYKEDYDEFLVTWEPKEGLKAKHHCVHEWPTPKLVHTERLDKYVAMVEKHKEDEKWNSTGVIEFLSLDPDALRETAWQGEWVHEQGYHDQYGVFQPIGEPVWFEGPW